MPRFSPGIVPVLAQLPVLFIVLIQQIFLLIYFPVFVCCILLIWHIFCQPFFCLFSAIQFCYFAYLAKLVLIIYFADFVQFLCNFFLCCSQPSLIFFYIFLIYSFNFFPFYVHSILLILQVFHFSPFLLILFLVYLIFFFVYLILFFVYFCYSTCSFFLHISYLLFSISFISFKR